MEKIEQMQKKILSKNFRNKFKDSFGKGWVIIGLSQISWFKKIQIKEVWVIMKYGIDIKNFINFQKIIFF